MKIKILFTLCFIASITGKAQNPDTTVQKLVQLYNLKAFYINQNAKHYVPAKTKTVYTTKLEAINKDIETYYNNKRNLIVQSGNQNELVKFSKDSLSREDDIELSRENKPTVYAYEIGSHTVGLFISFIKPNKYSSPIFGFYEKAITEKVSVGGFLGHFVENNVQAKTFQTDNPYYKFDWENYKYNYYAVGVKGSYHFFNPEKPFLNLNIYNFDPYVSALLGISIASDPKPYLENGMYTKAPLKKGVVAGAFAGLKYWYDERLGFFGEVGYAKTGFLNLGASYKFYPVEKQVKVEVEEPVKKGSKSSSSKGKSSSKKKKKKKKKKR